MTGTAKTEEEEFRDIYNMYVIEIPTNKPIARVDYADLIFATRAGKYKAIINEIKERHATGQPILVGTVAVETSELLSSMLKKEGIKHEVLNAKNNAREAEIIAKAGEKGSVTIATNMAGRGTDIKLTEEVKELNRKGIEIIREKYNLDSDEEIALKQIDAMKTELVNIYRFKQASGNDRFDLAPDKSSKLNDDRAYVMSMCSYALQKERRKNITQKQRPKTDTKSLVSSLTIRGAKRVSSFGS